MPLPVVTVLSVPTAMAFGPRFWMITAWRRCAPAFAARSCVAAPVRTTTLAIGPRLLPRGRLRCALELGQRLLRGLRRRRIAAANRGLELALGVGRRREVRVRMHVGPFG